VNRQETKPHPECVEFAQNCQEIPNPVESWIHSPQLLSRGAEAKQTLILQRFLGFLNAVHPESSSSRHYESILVINMEPIPPSFKHVQSRLWKIMIDIIPWCPFILAGVSVRNYHIGSEMAQNAITCCQTATSFPRQAHKGRAFRLLRTEAMDMGENM
jgi:hypothetical protein